MSDQRLKTGILINDRYRIESHIGAGGFSEVVAARDTEHDRSVALKVLHSDANRSDPRATERMIQEAEILRAITHPNIVEVYEVDTWDDGQFLVMEHVDGTGLDELIDPDDPLPTDRLLPLVYQLLDALSAAHSIDILHRDLKPENILVVDDGGIESIKLVDFGVAKVREVLNAEDPDEGVTLVKTRAGSFVGTPRYAAPEMVVGDPVGPGSDVFCVGLIVYEALMGNPLVKGETQAELMNELVFPRPFDLDDVPAPWPDWLDKILEKSPDHRIDSAKTALKRLEEVFPDAALSTPSQMASTDTEEMSSLRDSDDNAEIKTKMWSPEFFDESDGSPPADKPNEHSGDCAAPGDDSVDADTDSDDSVGDSVDDEAAAGIRREVASAVGLDTRELDESVQIDLESDVDTDDIELDGTALKAARRARMHRAPSDTNPDSPQTENPSAKPQPPVIGPVALFVLLALLSFAVAAFFLL